MKYFDKDLEISLENLVVIIFRYISHIRVLFITIEDPWCAFSLDRGLR